MAERPAAASLLLLAVCSLAFTAGFQPPAPAPGPSALLAKAVDLPAFSAVQASPFFVAGSLLYLRLQLVFNTSLFFVGL